MVTTPREGFYSSDQSIGLMAPREYALTKVSGSCYHESSLLSFNIQYLGFNIAYRGIQETRQLASANSSSIVYFVSVSNVTVGEFGQYRSSDRIPTSLLRI